MPPPEKFYWDMVYAWAFGAAFFFGLPLCYFWACHVLGLNGKPK